MGFSQYEKTGPWMSLVGHAAVGAEAPRHAATWVRSRIVTVALSNLSAQENSWNCPENVDELVVVDQAGL